jgi:TRAP-type mannitol/chloroaromatic compound transport system substrate-binding protein
VIARPLPDAVLKRLREITNDVLNEAAAEDRLTRKVHDSYMAYKKRCDAWATYGEGPYHEKVLTA